MDEKEIKKRLMVTFEGELDEHLRTLDKGLLALDQGLPEEEVAPLLDELFRAVHSLKGASRPVELHDIENIAHRMEDVVGDIKRKELTVDTAVCDTLFAGVDALRDAMSAHLRGEMLSSDRREGVLNRLRAVHDTKAKMPAGKTARAPAATAEKPPATGTPRTAQHKVRSEPETRRAVASTQPAGGTVRIGTAKLDALLTGVGQLLNARMRIEHRLSELRDVQERFAHLEKRWRVPVAGAGKDAPAVARGESPSEGIRQLGATVDQCTRSFADDFAYLSLLTDELQDEVRRIRMFPLDDLLTSFPRMVRDLAHERRKDVILETEGADTELDRHVMEAIKDPLTHLLRNAVDHGIELPDEREASGKTRRGTIRIRAEQKGDTVVVAVSDDGRGIDLEGIRRAAVRSGVVTEERAARQTEREAMDLMFHSGLSTKTQSSEISGRGVGMDVVRKNLEGLHGLIGVESTAGMGTTFTMTLPLTVATTHVLLVAAGDQTVAVPTRNVIRILGVDPDSVGSVEGKQTIHVDGEPVPLIGLSRVLEFSEAAPVATDGRKMPVVLLGAVAKRVAVCVDGLCGTQIVVMKPLGTVMKRVRTVAGGSILGSGQVVIVLNVADIITATQGSRAVAPKQRVPAAPEIPRRRVLVVDDSITTRTLERNILENAGYKVLVAADGEEACAIAESGNLDAIVSDVDMPRMDGIALTEWVRANERVRELPVILVTALHSQEDRLRGLEAGADAYIAKGTFDQNELLETMERLVG